MFQFFSIKKSQGPPHLLYLLKLKLIYNFSQSVTTLMIILGRTSFLIQYLEDYISLLKLWASYSKPQEVFTYWLIFFVKVNTDEL